MNHRSLLRSALLALLAPVLLSACGETKKSDEPPVAQWLKDNEDCTRASAQAVLDSGLPYPNRKTETYTDEKGRQKTRTVSIDMWLGPDRFVIPGAVAGSNSMYPLSHPRYFQRLGGSLPNFYPPGPRADEINGMGSMVDVQFRCWMTPAYVASWGTGYRSNEEGIQKIREIYEKRKNILPDSPGEVILSRREDLGMTEVLLDRKSEANDQRFWEASYWPLDRELKGLDGSVSAIRCDTRHDPEQRRYGGRGWTCNAGFRLTKFASVRIDIYVTHITQMPAVFDQVQRLLVSARQTTHKE